MTKDVLTLDEFETRLNALGLCSQDATAMFVRLLRTRTWQEVREHVGDTGLMMLFSRYGRPEPSEQPRYYLARVAGLDVA